TGSIGGMGRWVVPCGLSRCAIGCVYCRLDIAVGIGRHGNLGTICVLCDRFFYFCQLPRRWWLTGLEIVMLLDSVVCLCVDAEDESGGNGAGSTEGGRGSGHLADHGHVVFKALGLIPLRERAETARAATTCGAGLGAVNCFSGHLFEEMVRFFLDGFFQVLCNRLPERCFLSIGGTFSGKLLDQLFDGFFRNLLAAALYRFFDDLDEPLFERF